MDAKNDILLADDLLEALAQRQQQIEQAVGFEKKLLLGDIDFDDNEGIANGE